MNISGLIKVVSTKAISSSGGALFQLLIISAIPMAEVGRFNVLVAIAMGLVVFLKTGYDVALFRDSSYYWRSFQQELILPSFFAYFVEILKQAVLIFSIFLLVNYFVHYFEIYNSLESSELIYTLAFSLMISFLFLISSVQKSIGNLSISAIAESGFCFFISATVGVFLIYVMGKSFEIMPIVLISTISVVFFSFAIALSRLGGFHEKYINKIEIKKESKLFAVNFFSYLSTWGIILVFNAFYDDADTGKFSSAMRFGMLLNFLLMMANLYVTPKISFLVETNDIKKLEEEIRKYATLLFLLGSVVFLAVWLGIKFIGFSDENLIISNMTLIVMLGQLVNISSGATGYLLTLTHNENIYLKSLVIGGVLGLVSLAFCGYFKVNIYVATASCMLIPVVTTILSIIFIKRVFNFYSIPSFKITK